MMSILGLIFTISISVNCDGINIQSDTVLSVGAAALNDSSLLALSAKNDADAMTSAFRGQIRTVAHVLVGGEATSAGIDALLARAAAAKSKSPRLLLYLSGRYAVVHERLFYQAADTVPGKPQSGYAVDDLVRKLAADGFRDLVLVFDASSMETAPAGWESAQIDLAPADNAVVLIGWPDGPRKESKDMLLHSPMTRALLDTWTEPALAGVDGWTWLPKVAHAMRDANDPNAPAARLIIQAKMTDVSRAMWLKAPKVRATPKARAGEEATTAPPEVGPSKPAPATQPTEETKP